jgi:MFS family permease
MSRENDEERPLLHPDREDADASSYSSHDTHQVQFADDDEENPKAWSRRKKIVNVAIIALMAILSPLASSMFTPGISQIAKDLNTDEQKVIATTTGFVIMMGIGPLVLAPFSETFGRRLLYIWCFSVFTLLQLASALSPNIATLIALRTISGFFGSVGLANGGGTLSDMYNASERAGIFGWYLLGPLLGERPHFVEACQATDAYVAGPTLGPLFGGVIVNRLGWRWIYWVSLGNDITSMRRPLATDQRLADSHHHLCI